MIEIVAIILHAYAFYLGFALSISVYRLWEQGKLNLLNKILFAPVLIVFAALDVLLNYTLLVLVFGLPRGKDYTISARFETYRNTETGYKRAIADFTCEKLLSTIGPTGKHC